MTHQILPHGYEHSGTEQGPTYENALSESLVFHQRNDPVIILFVAITALAVYAEAIGDTNCFFLKGTVLQENMACFAELPDFK